MGNLYLVAYNGTLAAAWGYVLYLTITTVLEGGWTHDVYQKVDTPLKWAQTAAIMEVIHSGTGLVKSPFFTTFIQVLSRLWALWGLVNLEPIATTTQSVVLLKWNDKVLLQLNFISLMICWCCSEVLRYTFYVFKELSLPVPYPLLWLRYSAFIVLYPFGVGSELSMAYLAMPYIKANKDWTIEMPNKWNFAFDYYIGCWIAILCYLPGLPELYMYMLKQRKKILGPAPKAKKT